MVTLSQGNNISAKANFTDLISKQGIHSALIIHNFLNMPHARGMAFNLLGGCTGKKGPKGCRGYLSLLFNNPPFLHSPDF